METVARRGGVSATSVVPSFVSFPFFQIFRNLLLLLLLLSNDIEKVEREREGGERKEKTTKALKNFERALRWFLQSRCTVYLDVEGGIVEALESRMRYREFNEPRMPVLEELLENEAKKAHRPRTISPITLEEGCALSTFNSPTNPARLYDGEKIFVSTSPFTGVLRIPSGDTANCSYGKHKVLRSGPVAFEYRGRVDRDAR